VYWISVENSDKSGAEIAKKQLNVPSRMTVLEEIWNWLKNPAT
jgi:hypothetical protein